MGGADAGPVRRGGRAGVRSRWRTRWLVAAVALVMVLVGGAAALSVLPLTAPSAAHTGGGLAGVDESGAAAPPHAPRAAPVRTAGEEGAVDNRDGQVARERVVLVHGMGRTEFSMLLLAWSLERNDYDVLNWGYSSLCCTVEELGEQLAAAVARERAAAPDGPPLRFHFVGHSLGNIIIRWVVSHEPDGPWGNVVMLAPPNQGSHSADDHVRWLAWLLRPLPGIVTAEGSTARTLPWPAHVPAGVIAGRFDGKVDVEETHLPGETAHVVVPSMHTFIMNRMDVRRLTLEFLRNGRFGTGS